MKDLTDVRKISEQELKKSIAELNEPTFRANQILEWVWKKSVRSFGEMTNLPKSLIEKLNKQFKFYPIILDKEQLSNDGTIKSRFKLYDGHLIEAVLIPVPAESRFTVCVSCQVGCSLTCSFCATGRMERIRNLDPAEIYDQVVMVNAQCMAHFGKPITNVVYMGMGEPLLAYQNVLDSIKLLTSEQGLHMSAKRITVSTAGIAKMIKKLADDDVKFNLALSLHAADDKKRNEIMPINESNNLKTLTEALQYFQIKSGNRITFEYIAFQNFNLGEEDAKNLIKIYKKVPARINIIEYNPIDNAPFTNADFDQVDHFAKILREAGVMVTVRKSRGKDIDAACGQLANKA
ncbi:MAG: 23S rRNA (adenine(2503)-C(2))-methyltransferase RlmN [Saprospiraceae bacterium]|nr:23S rRNA (adenine(2503)-C(2))-methyltransferase RlmN [Saprospiraceae bacterium]